MQQRFAPPPGSRPRVALWGALLAAACIAAAVQAWVCDDVFITFRYTDNLLAGRGPVYNAGERSEGYTHALWFWLLALGRAAHVSPETLGRYAGLPWFAASLGILVWLSGRLFPGRGGMLGVPVAALAWGLHEDARRFASGGLETAAFTCSLLGAFACLAASRAPRRGAWAGWALAVAWLLRPDALVVAGLAAVWLAARREWRVLRDLAFVGGVLVVPHLAFRWIYYGYPLPNPYYAKSADVARWPQGWTYLQTYFAAYFVLLLAVPVGLAIAMRAARARAHRQPVDANGAALGLAAAWAAAIVLLVTRAGGDFMFARFFLPVTPFLLLLCEAAVQAVPRTGLRVAAAAAVVALIGFGAVRKHAVFADRAAVRGIVDEPQVYPASRWAEVRAKAVSLRACLAGTGAALLVHGGQAGLAYYAQFPVAIERHGLTDEHIAHARIGVRGRPGHEKFADWEYLVQRRVLLRINHSPVHNVPIYTLFGLEGITGEILIYDRAFMEHLKTCAGARFLDFPQWLRNDYIPRLPGMRRERMITDWNDFQRFYFAHNPDPEDLRGTLRAALAAQGLVDIPTLPVVPRFADDLATEAR